MRGGGEYSDGQDEIEMVCIVKVNGGGWVFNGVS